MTLNKLIVITCFTLAPALLVGQNAAPPAAQTGLDPGSIAKPLGDSWPTYSGDYSGRRYSSLTQINQSNVKNLGLAWISRGFVQGSGPTGHGRAAGFRAGADEGGLRLTAAGEGSGDFNGGGPA